MINLPPFLASWSVLHHRSPNQQDGAVVLECFLTDERDSAVMMIDFQHHCVREKVQDWPLCAFIFVYM